MNLPADFDPAVNLIGRQEDNGLFHSIVYSAKLVESLMRDEAGADMETVEAVINAVLDSQITNPADPHFGNFLWERELEVVEDLNAVNFVLFRFVPLMTDFTDRFTAKTFERMLVAVRNGLVALERIDVHLLYTNIVLKDISITCLGGELLGDREIAERGYLKMRRWFDRTNDSGMPTEYNSPTYTKLAIEVLGRLSVTTTDEGTRVLSELAGARLAVSAALRINPVTRRWAGPFGRAYRDVVLAEGFNEPRNR